MMEDWHIIGVAYPTPVGHASPGEPPFKHFRWISDHDLMRRESTLEINILRREGLSGHPLFGGIGNLA